MNIKMIRYILGQLSLVECALMLVPTITCLCYGEYSTVWSFIIPMLMLLAIGTVLVIFKPKNTTIGVKEGFVIVGMSWMVMSFFGCLPFMISGLIPNFFDAYFETVSGFTTTGSSVLNAADYLKLWEPISSEVGMRGIFMWRSFTHWVGGMGVLVFVLAFMPQHDLKSSKLVYIMKAECPGPKVDKLVSTIKKTARIMYAIYFIMTVIMAVLLLFGGMDVYESMCISFGTAGTGGFSIWADNMVTLGGAEHYSFCIWVITVFMLLFSVNFNLYYLIITGKVLTAIMSEELRWFASIVVVAIAIVTANTMAFGFYNDLSVSVRDAAFQVATIISTSGFANVNFDLWPYLSKIVLFILMFIGACAGSTGGSIKVSRIVITAKTAWTNIRKMLHPRDVKMVRFEGKIVDESTKSSTFAYFVIYAIVYFVSFFLVTLFDGVDMETSFSAVACTLNNIGPGFSRVGPFESFSFLSIPSKIVLTLDMLIGRLEIFPMLFLFSPSVWRKK